MSFKFKKTEGGHKAGHSNVVHWTGTEEIKKRSKKSRRKLDKELSGDVEEQFDEELKYLPNYLKY